MEFGDGRDKKRIMEMCPWTYEKHLILLKEFEGEQVPKDISLWLSAFWVQIHNLPLKSRTTEMGRAIGAKLGEVLDVDVAESGIHWGKIFEGESATRRQKEDCEREKDCHRKREQRWITFKYERLSNFCYHCGLLSHGLKDCEERKGVEEHLDLSKLQYGAWLRGDTQRRGGGDVTKVGHEEEEPIGEGRQVNRREVR